MGTGGAYNKHVNLLKYYELKNEIKVVAVTSYDLSPKIKAIDSFAAIGLSELNSLEYDYLIIMSDVYYKEIRDKAIGIGVKAEINIIGETCFNKKGEL